MASFHQWLTAFFIFLLVGHAQAQPSLYQVTHYDETTGLESNVINAMLQDHRGYLWFGTADGLCRFDGYSFVNFRKKSHTGNSLPGNFITRMAEDKNGIIWMGLLKDGISSYDPATGIFKNYDVKNIDTSAPLARSIKMIVIDQQNNVWAGLSHKGLLKLNRETGQFQRYDIIPDSSTFYSAEFKGAYNNVYDMYQQSTGIYWLATHDGLYRFDEHKGLMKPVRAQPLLKEPGGGLNGNQVRDDLFGSVICDGKGLWLGSFAGGLSYFDFDSQCWSNYKFTARVGNVATSNIITDIKKKSDTEIWVASADRGISIFNTSTHRFSFLADSANSGIPRLVCGTMMIDKQSNIWMASAQGLYKIKPTDTRFNFVPLETRRHDNGSTTIITCMLEDREGKYCYTGTAYTDGLLIRNKKTGVTTTLSFATLAGEENTMTVSGLLEDKSGVIWLLTRDVVYQYQPEAKKLIKIPQPPLYLGKRGNYFTVIREDKKGRVWMATGRNGVFCYDPNSRQYAHYGEGYPKPYSLPSNVIVGLAVDRKGNLWMGGTRGCFGYIDHLTDTFVNLDQDGRASTTRSTNRLYTLYTDRDSNIVAGTDAGIYCYSMQTGKPLLTEIYNTDNGLRGDIVTSILEDREGNLWCTTGSAMCKVNRRTKKITTFRKQDGIDKVSQLDGLFHFQNGAMAAFTTQGYYLFDPAVHSARKEDMPAVITSFKIDNEEQFFEHSNGVQQVSAKANVVSFEFAALDFDRPDKQQYSYILEGFDKEWVEAGSRRYAGYANLPGGNYTFRVRASSTGEDHNEPVASLAIHVTAPFYKSWWFVTLSMLVAFLATWMFYRFKLRRQQQIQSLETKAQMLKKEKALAMYEGLKQQLNPHFLFNSLSSLNSLISYDQELAGEFLEELSSIYRYILKSRDAETVALTEEVKFVKNYIRLQQTRFGQGLVVDINLQAETDNGKIVPVTLQNLIENAIKHNVIDIDSPLHIQIFTEGQYLVVKNNLQKKNYVETSNKQGLANLTALYDYLSKRPVTMKEEEGFFCIYIPLL